MSEIENKDVSWRDKSNAILNVARYNPKFALLIVVLALAAAVLEGVGLTFILPIIEIVGSNDPVSNAEGIMLVFVTIYQFLNVPFTLEFVIVGVVAIMTLRYSTSFVVAWLREVLRTNYRRDLQLRAFDKALSARIGYFDKEGSDEIMNSIITETLHSARTIMDFVNLLNLLFLSLVYIAITFYVAPYLTLISAVVLGGITFLLRVVIEPGYDIGDRVAEANEGRHTAAQAGMIGIRDIRIFGLTDYIYQQFEESVDQFTRGRIKLRRNEAAINKFYNLSVAVYVFILIYLAITYADLSIGEMGLFLFAMFQLAPKVSRLNSRFYKMENNLPHLIRTQNFIAELERRSEPDEASRPVPAVVETIEFDNVSFSYNDDEPTLRGINFTVEKGEFIGVVGQSGAGKSTIVSLLARFYEPDDGRITANGIPINEMDAEAWRKRLAIVRQEPYIFNDTLRFNVTIGRPDASQREIEQVCEYARVDEFIDELPNGYDSNLGDDGVRLSGGQKQRVALARALLKDAELLLLDEATSDLDSNLEKEVQRAIEAMERDYAIIAIAHRLSTVENSDRIYTIENGKIIESGKHSELVDNGGKYAELYAIQSK